MFGNFARPPKKVTFAHSFYTFSQLIPNHLLCISADPKQTLNHMSTTTLSTCRCFKAIENRFFRVVTAPIRLRSSACVLAPQDPHSIPLLGNIHQNVQGPANKFDGMLGCKQLSHGCSQHSQMECPLPAATRDVCVPICSPYVFFGRFKTTMKTAIFSLFDSN